MNSVLGWGDEQFTIGGQESVPIRLIMCAREPFKWVKKEICDVLSFVIPKQKKPPFRTDMIQSKAVTVFSMIWPLGSTQ